MQSISTIGLDIAKSVFQVHGVDAAGQVVIRRQLKRRFVLSFFEKLPPCLVGIEACASSHYWSRELQALGHTVLLMPSGLCEAVRQAAEERQHRREGDLRGGHEAQHAVRPNQDGRATELSDASSSTPSVHSPADCRHQFNPRLSCRVRDCRPRRAQGVEQLLEVVADTYDRRLPAVGRACLAALGSQLRALKAHILEFDRRIIAWHRSHATSKRLDAIPGVGPALATALVASVADANVFRSGRDFSAWVGLVPNPAAEWIIQEVTELRVEDQVQQGIEFALYPFDLGPSRLDRGRAFHPKTIHPACEFVAEFPEQSRVHQVVA